MDAPRPRSIVLGALSAGLVVVFFCLILLWHDPLVFWNDDYELSVLPVFADVARSWSEGHWPILSPYSWVCGNLAGEFQYGTFSLFINAAVILIWKFPLTFPQQAAALSIAHVFMLAVGAFLLARDRRLSVPLSIFVALVASLNGWIICWGATDWFGALGAFTWLPWAWWGAERALDPRRTKWRFLWPAPFVYLLVTGGFPYTVLMLLLLIGWLSIKSLVQTRSISSILPMLFGVALGFGLSAPAWLAILDLVQGSARELQSPKAHWQWLVPPAALPGLILPSWTVNWTDFSSRHVPHTATELACGVVAPAALIAGFIWRGRMLIARLKWELILLLVVLLLSMLPTAGLFRWSFRWLPFFHLVLAICAAEILHIRSGSPIPATAALVLTALTAIAILILHTAGSYGFPLTWIVLGLAATWCLSELFLRDSEFHKCVPVVITFLALLATYLCIPTNCGVPRYNFSQELLKPSPLDPQRLYLSIYPWAELTYATSDKPQAVGQTLRPGSTSMWAGLHFINGYSPIRAAGVAREFAASIHGEINPDVGSYLLRQQAGKDGELALLGVDGIVVTGELDLTPQPASEWELVISMDEGRVFHRRGAPLARVRAVTSIHSRPNQQFASATISKITDSRDWVETDVDVANGDQPALLTFSRPYFRGYNARLGNQKLAVTSYRGLFPVVEVPAGVVGRLTLAYRPRWLVWGGSFAVGCGFIVLFGLIAASRYSRSNAVYDLGAKLGNQSRLLLVRRILVASTTLCSVTLIIASFIGGRFVEGQTQRRLSAATDEADSSDVFIRTIASASFGESWNFMRKASPEKRTAWARQLEQFPLGTRRNATIESFYKIWVELDPIAAVRGVETIRDSRLQSLAFYATAGAAADSALGAIVEIENRLDYRTNDFSPSSVFARWAAADPEAAAQFLVAHPMVRSARFFDAVFSFATTDPTTAAEWVVNLKLPPLHDPKYPRMHDRRRLDAMRGLFLAWLDKDWRSAAAFATAHANDPDVNQAIGELGRVLFTRSHEDAKEFIQSLPDEKTQRAALVDLLEYMRGVIVMSEGGDEEEPQDPEIGCKDIAPWLVTLPANLWVGHVGDIFRCWDTTDSVRAEAWLRMLPASARSNAIAEYCASAPIERAARVLQVIPLLQNLEMQNHCLQKFVDRMSDDPSKARAKIAALSLTPNQKQILMSRVRNNNR